MTTMTTMTGSLTARALDETATPLVLLMRRAPRDLLLPPGIPRVETARRAGAYLPHTVHTWVHCADDTARVDKLGHVHWCLCGARAPDLCHGSGRVLRPHHAPYPPGSVERFDPERGRAPQCSRSRCPDPGVARVVSGEDGWLCWGHERHRVAQHAWARRQAGRA